MKVTVELEPFEIPNRVLAKSVPGNRGDGFVPKMHFRLTDLDVNTLDEMCLDFRRRIFEAAGKQDPVDTRGPGV